MINISKLLKKIKALTEKFVYSKHMLISVGIASFLESIIVPIPLETILIPLMQARRERIFWIATFALIGCILGASVGYAVGYFLMNAIGPDVIQIFGTQEQFERVKQQMQNKGFWFVFSVGIVPIPFQIAMLAAGATQYAFYAFITASLLSRAARYYGLMALVWFAGDKAENLFAKHKKSATAIICLVVLIAWAFAIWG